MVFFLTTLSVVIIDQLTKYLASQFLASGDSVPIIQNVFYLSLVHNRGIAFGLLQGRPFVLLALVFLSIFVLLYLIFMTDTKQFWTKIALSVVLGGALGNLIDRIRLGAVVDFLDFKVWPVFNVADCAVSGGVVLLLICILLKR